MMDMGQTEISVTEALYQARGCPPLDKPVVFETQRTCGNCQRLRDTAPAKRVLTSQFGSWGDIIQDPKGGRWLCLPCASTYRATDVRRRTSIIRQHGSLECADLGTLRAMLSNPIPADVAVVVPLSGKRLIAPRAQWGTVITDTCLLKWSSRHKRLMDHAVTLREMGFTETGLRAPSPPFVVLSGLPVDQHAQVRSMWRDLKTVREDKTLLPFYLFLSRKVA